VIKDISGSLVLFHNEPELYGGAISSFLNSCDGTLHIVDNSVKALKHELFRHPRVKYLFVGRNLGFGAAHNLALTQLTLPSDVHLLLNPDISFDSEVLPSLVKLLQMEADIGAVMPRVIYPNGTHQHLSKLLPTPIDLILRRFLPITLLKEHINRRYELHALCQDRNNDIPSLSGCFLLIRTAILQDIGGFDERYFMYMEDVDLVRRVGDVARTVYCPSISVTHDYGKGSYHNAKLLSYHLKSAVKYFNKWGWFYDPIRTTRNRRILATIKAG